MKESLRPFAQGLEDSSRNGRVASRAGVGVKVPVLTDSAPFGLYEILGRIGERQVQNRAKLGQVPVLTSVARIASEGMGDLRLHPQLDQ